MLLTSLPCFISRGRQNNDAPKMSVSQLPKSVDILSYMDFADMIKLGLLRWAEYFGASINSKVITRVRI